MTEGTHRFRRARRAEETAPEAPAEVEGPAVAEEALPVAEESPAVEAESPAVPAERDDVPEDAATDAATTPAGPEAAPEGARPRRKVRTGVVVSDKMDKTVVVRIDSAVRHPLYRKTVRRSAKLAAHDEGNEAHVGDTVRVMETRPASKTKRWRVVKIVERAR